MLRVRWLVRVGAESLRDILEKVGALPACISAPDRLGTVLVLVLALLRFGQEVV